MKRLLMVLAVALAVSVASAQSAGYGIYTGYPVLLGGQYQTGNFRLSAGLPWFGFGVFGIGASADVILGQAPVRLGPDLTLSFYYGAGANAALYFGGGSFFLADAHGLLGLEYLIANSGFSVYGESQLGIGFYGTAIGPAFGGRFGIIFH